MTSKLLQSIPLEDLTALGSAECREGTWYLKVVKTDRTIRDIIKGQPDLCRGDTEWSWIEAFTNYDFYTWHEVHNYLIEQLPMNHKGETAPTFDHEECSSCHEFVHNEDIVSDLESCVNCLAEIKEADDELELRRQLDAVEA